MNAENIAPMAAESPLKPRARALRRILNQVQDRLWSVQRERRPIAIRCLAPRPASAYYIALHYSYDLSGNLKTLTYDMPRLAPYRQQFKRIDYDYDLYSGKVTLVSYDRGFADQFYQRYAYDDDNRVTKTETSRDGLLWERDAEYKYYPHGPLARISLGERRVQGIDFAYTLQGWLKSINGDAPDSTSDMGGDGRGNSAHQSDLYRTTLSYFAGDYRPLDSTNNMDAAGSSLLRLPAPAANRSLYNGNIAAATNLPGYFAPLYTAYRYDKLNRIKSAGYAIPAYASTAPLSAGTGGVGSLYYNNYGYDPDGNLTALNRYGYNTASSQPYLMDSLAYYYLDGTRTNNRLTNYTDTANHGGSSPGAGFTNDIAKYSPPGAATALRMQYDKTGNLSKDLSNGLTKIDWTLYGKTAKVVKDDGHTLTFTYDPLGNRFSKTVYTARAGIDSTLHTEYYIREAGGNVLATYRQQQHYYYYDPTAVLVSLAASPTLAGAIVATYGGGGPLGYVLVSSTAAQMPAAFATARVSSRSAGFYGSANSGARAALTGNMPQAGWRLAGYDSVLSGRLWPAGAGYDGQALQALAGGITDTALLQYSARLLFKGSDSAAMEGRYRQVTGYEGDSGRAYSAAELGGYLADEILEWRHQGGAERAGAELGRMLWGLDSTGRLMDTTGRLYAGALGRLLKDSAYMEAPLWAGAMLDSTATMPHTLNGVVLGRLVSGDAAQATGRIVTTGENSAIPVGPDGLGRVLSGFLDQYYSVGSRNDSGIAMLRRSVGDEALLGAVYADSPAVFMASLLSGEGAGADMTTGKSIVAAALKMTVGGSNYGVSSPVGMSAALGNASASLRQTLGAAWVLGLDYDRFYLAEHDMYGSSRLGIKKYWPYEYRYEWSRNKTAAENQATLDSNDIAYRKPWYYQNWESLVTANETNPVGHANVTAQTTTRIVGQKNYELTNHLGNVMAVVSDKVTEVKANSSASLPTLAMKRAGLSAAYDYYPFGMLMPDRFREDNSIQCIPVTRTRMVNQVNLVGDQIDPANNSIPGPFLTASTGGGGVITVSSGMSGGEVASVDFGQDVEVFMNLPAFITGQIGLEVKTHIVPAVDGTTTVSLNRVLSPSDPNSAVEQVTSVDVMNEGDADILAEDLSVDDTYRLVIHYSASVPLMGVPGASAKMTINNVIYSVVTKVAQSYVAMSCDTDGSFDGSYRFGFNGQQKTNEIAGVGNHNTALFWEYDTRAARRWNIDPKSMVALSPYSCFVNSPIWFRDPLGDLITVTGPSAAAFLEKLNKESSVKFKYDNNGRLQLVNPKAKVIGVFAERMVHAATTTEQNVTLQTTEGQQDGILMDSQRGGLLDVTDLNNTDGAVYKSSLLHIIAERFDTKDYDKKITVPRTITGKEIDDGHKAGLKAEEEFFKELYPDKEISFKGEGYDKVPMSLNPDGTGTKGYTVDFGDVKKTYALPMEKDGSIHLSIVPGQTKTEVKR